MSQDIVFNESASWYDVESISPEPAMNDLDNTDQLRSIHEESLILTRLSEAQGPPCDRSTSQSSPKMDKGKAKISDFEDDQFDGNELTRSLDNEFGAFDVTIMRTLRVKESLPTTRVHDVTLHEKYYGKKPDLFHLRIFSSNAYMHIPNKKQQKLDPELEKCIRVGYSLEQKGYKFFKPSTQKVCVSQYIVFN